MPDTTTLPAEPVERQHAPGLEVREVQIRSVDAAKREVYGIAVPWDQEVRIAGWTEDYYESVQRGACTARDGEPKAFWEHRQIIGRAVSTRDTDEGWEVALRISETTTGNDVLALVRDGSIDRFSIGFVPIEHTEREDEDGVRHVVRTRIEVREVSLVPFPAYDGAKVAGHRHEAPEQHPTTHRSTDKETPMTDTTTDIAEVRESVEDLTRAVELLRAEGAVQAPHTDEFRSIGDYVKHLVAGDERAVRAFEGAVSGDGIAKDAWVGAIIDLQRQAQPIVQAFGGTKPLPEKGLNVEWGVLTDDSTDFDTQVDEGDELVVGKITLDTRTAPVVTAGGRSNLSAQAIERTTNVSLIDTVWEALALKAARYVERLGRKAALDQATANATDADAENFVVADLTTAEGIVEALIDVYEHFDGRDLSLAGLFVSKDVFLSLYGVQAVDSVLQVSGAPADKVGTMSVRADVSADLAGLNVRLFPGAPSGTVFGYDARAVQVLEAPGAPFRITNELRALDLTKPIGMYTYVSAFAQRPNGIVPLLDTAPTTGGGGAGGEG